jgi:hypothetical protein
VHPGGAELRPQRAARDRDGDGCRGAEAALH